MLTATKQDRLAYTKKSQEIVDQMSLEEKVALMSGKIAFEDIMADIANGHHYNW